MCLTKGTTSNMNILKYDNETTIPNPFENEVLKTSIQVCNYIITDQFADTYQLLTSKTLQVTFSMCDIPKRRTTFKLEMQSNTNLFDK